ncbi:hypothetical protein LTR94_037415, partial [Friedmanniomyces endolithicus]
ADGRRRRGAGPVRPGPRSLQGGQRPVRPRGRRPAAVHHRRAHEGRSARGRIHCASGRGRIPGAGLGLHPRRSSR